MMTNRTKLLLAAGVIALGSTALVSASMADEWGRGHHRGHGEPGGGYGMRMMELFDTNQDGQVTQVEIDEVRTSRFAEFDQNNDGNLNLEEYQALWLDAMRERMVDRFQDLDDDGDAIVTSEEFVEPFGRMVQRMDHNEDGVISRDDMRRGQQDHDRGPGRDRDSDDGDDG
jgi:Ca2+-binding EF-hand superfamily protein